MIKINHIKCDVCNKEITCCEDIESLEISNYPFFELSRSKHNFYCNDIGEIEENIENKKEKMLRCICEDCFVKILNESKTLGNNFLVKEKNMFIY